MPNTKLKLHSELASLCKYEYDYKKQKSEVSFSTQLKIPRNWELMGSDEERDSGKDLYVGNNAVAFIHRDGTIAIVVNFDFNSNFSNKDNHYASSVTSKLDENLQKIHENYSEIDDFVRYIHLLHCYRVFTYFLYGIMAGTTKYWGFFDPKLIITGFRDNGSLAEMISLSYGIEAVTFESCGVPIKPGSTWKGKVNAVITRYVFTPNLTNTQFPIPKNSNITTYCLFHVNPEEIAKKISEKTTMSYSVSSRVVNTSKEIGAHGLSHSVDHFAIKAGLEKLIERGIFIRYDCRIFSFSLCYAADGFHLSA